MREIADTSGVGTVAYMAPEVTRQDTGVYSGCAADIWSSGAMLLTGVLYVLPFGNGMGPKENVKATIERIQKCELVPEAAAALQGLSPSLQALIAELLQVDPSLRPTAERMRAVSCGDVPLEQAGALRWLGEEVCAAPGLSAAVAMGGPLAGSEPEPMGVE